MPYTFASATNFMLRHETPMTTITHVKAFLERFGQTPYDFINSYGAVIAGGSV